MTTMTVTSTAFADGKTIPTQYTCDGADISPPLAWTGVPTNAKSLALIVDDPDAPAGTWVHWVLYNLPATQTSLQGHVPPHRTLDNGAQQGINSSKKIGYSGPCPPPGKPHRYFFKLYALDTALKLQGDVTAKQLTAAMQGHILAEGQIMGRYGRT